MDSVEGRLVAGTEARLADALAAVPVSRTVNTSFVERRHGTDRGHGERKERRTYRVSKDGRAHEAMTYFRLCRYNSSRVIRILRQRDGRSWRRRRTPAMASGLSDHVWFVREWASYPAIKVAKDTIGISQVAVSHVRSINREDLH